jgi:hypothetical protein
MIEATAAFRRARFGLLPIVVLTTGIAVKPALAQAPACDQACLSALAGEYLDAMLKYEQMAIPGELAPLPWAEQVGFTENDVGLMMGDGLWGTATSIGEGYTLADPVSGNVLWLGIVEEHGQPAYLALRLGVEGRRLAEVEAIVGREGTPAPFAPTDGYAVDRMFSRTVPAAERLPRARLEALVTGYYSSLQMNDGTVQSEFSPDCERLTNGFSTTHGEGLALRGCREQIAAGLYRYVDRIRAVRFPVIDETRGVVVALAFLDHAARYVDYQTLDGITRKVPIEYPNTHSVLEVFKIEGGRITRIEGVTAFQPYLMPTQWMP